MVLEGCQGQPKTPTLMEVKCPQCGEIIEVFSTDEEVTCEKCGYVYHNEIPQSILNCGNGQDKQNEERRDKFIEDALKF